MVIMMILMMPGHADAGDATLRNNEVDDADHDMNSGAGRTDMD